MKIKSMPLSERPYEKLEMYGEKTLSNSELLAIILKTGTKEQTSVALAQNILALKGNGNLRELQDISLKELQEIKGVGKVKAIQIKAICELAKRMERPLRLNTTITSPNDVANLLMNELRYEKKEIIKILILNTKNVIKRIIDIGAGDISSSKISIREVVEEIIKTGMKKFILVHNHPSGIAEPSTKDIEVTKEIKKAAELLEIQFIDHIIIGDGTFYSMLSISKNKKNN